VAVFGRTKERTGSGGRGKGATPQQPVVLTKPGGKNRPTPKRSQAQAANRRPLVGADRKGATAASRLAGRDERRQAQAGRMAGVEKYLPARDRGPVKAYLRDVVDARRNLGEYLIVFLVVLLLAQYVVQFNFPLSSAYYATYGLLYAGVIAVAVDAGMLRRTVRTKVAERFGPQALERGVVSYAVMRSLQLRRARIPKPVVARGQSPR
jgi:hypothetical protein